MMWTLVSAALAQAPPPIVNGEETTDFPEVGVLVFLDAQWNGAPFCSGTLVHERWVITAAHCVDAMDDYSNWYDTYFFIGHDLYAAGGYSDYAKADEWYPHPDYTPNGAYYDIGLVGLEGSGIQSVDPMPVNDDDIEPEHDGELITYVGWGVTGDSQRGSGVKRTVDVPILDSDWGLILTYSDTGENICSGDSGGAALMPTANGWELVGANSFGFDIYGGYPTCEGDGAAAGATRVDTFLESFIADHIDLEELDLDEGGSSGGTTGGGSTETGSGGNGAGTDTSNPGGGTTGEDDEPARPMAPDDEGCATAPAAAGWLTFLAAGVGWSRRRDHT